MGEIGLKLQGAAGILVMLGLCYALSSDRRAVRPRIVVLGLGLLFGFAFLVLKTAPGRWFFAQANAVITRLLAFAAEGAWFVFGALGWPPDPERSVPPWQDVPPDMRPSLGFFFAFQTLTTIIFFASLMAILYHYGVMQRVVKGVAWVMLRTLKTSGAESLSAAANIFVGQTEAPLLVRPFIARMTRSEIMAIMTGGFATVAGGVMAAYVGMLSGVFPDIAGHLLAASVMAAPTGLMVAKILMPETSVPQTSGSLDIRVERTTRNGIDAAAAGASDGMQLALNVGAMLLAFVALIALINSLLAWIGVHAGLPHLQLEWLLKYLFAPLAFLMGVPWDEALRVSELLGLKLVATEFVAFQRLGTEGADLSPRTLTMVSYALCGFANLASIAIQIGGIGAMAPERRSDLAEIGLKAMAAGFLTTCITAAAAGILI